MAESRFKATINLPVTAFPMKANLPTSEPKWLQRWQQEDVYGQIRAARKGRPLFVLHDGPPYANGAIHLGTALNKVVKDFVVKSKSMAGFDAPYIPGWDCHGLPIEIKVDQELGPRKRELSVVEIRERCEQYARKYVALQRAGFERLGVFGQWNDPYLTLNPAYEAAIAEQILTFIKRGQAYKGLRAVYWCTHDRTALAEAEVEYKNHLSPTVWLRYAYKSGELPGGIAGRNLFAVVWTTTPWTLPASTALAFHPELNYVAVRNTEGEVYLVADARFEATASALGVGWGREEIIACFPGSALEGVMFQHPWLEREEPAVLAEYITTDQGSGIVHTAPGHGAEDFATGEKYKLPVICPVDATGRFFGADSAPFTGQTITEANPRIVAHLRSLGALLAEAPLEHSYPHCWRCHNPVMMRATEQWFIALDRGLRAAALEAIKSVRWMPAWGEERIRQMVATRPDWCISRQRVWGVPIPVLACTACHAYLHDDATDRRIIAAFAERGSNQWFTEPASRFVAEGTRCAQCGKGEFQQERDIVDVWFESGCSQAAVLNASTGLPFPADLYLEGGDQYRGWFQSSLLVAIGTRAAAPYRETLTHGWVLDAEGHTMHKSLGNAIEPDAITGEYGAEVLRLWVGSSDFREEIRLSPELLKRLAEAYRKIRNTFRFLLGNLHGFDFQKDALAPSELAGLDGYMIRQTARMALEVERQFEAYEFHRACRILSDFCSLELSAFYLDVRKDRLYTAPNQSRDRRSTQTVLWHALQVLVRLLAPILPFTTEEVWATLGHTGSIHCETNVDVRAWWGQSRESDIPEDTEWVALLGWREEVLKALELARAEKRIGTSLEAAVELRAAGDDLLLLEKHRAELAALFIVSQVRLEDGGGAGARDIRIVPAAGAKCERCWNYSTAVGTDTEYPTLCERCVPAIKAMREATTTA
ncbi:MAG TPA: isoleucine--tRNA ligase [Terriglobales bacterium]|nr:isoleucine--tRNA ligase [Terriglobales bacterium]